MLKVYLYFGRFVGLCFWLLAGVMSIVGLAGIFFPELMGYKPLPLRVFAFLIPTALSYLGYRMLKVKKVF